jgi:23S rRNA (guanosine2251-2'-O)-methyltransferase
MLRAERSASQGPQIGARLIVASHRQRNDPRNGPKKAEYDPARSPGNSTARPPSRPRGGRRDELSADWIWGVHPVIAALENPAREVRRVLATADRARQITEQFSALKVLEITDAQSIARVLPQGASHQGLAMKSPPPEPMSIEDLGEPAQGFLLMLDQVTDPQNVGAILRSAAAFGARGVIVQDRHAPALTGALAKAAAGAVDRIPHARAVNLSRALEQLEAMGWRAVGLDGEAKDDLETILDGRPTVIVMGSEGEGLRRLVREHCDALARIPMPGGFESLNVSNAAAVALYAASRVIR